MSVKFETIYAQIIVTCSITAQICIEKNYAFGSVSLRVK